MSTVEKNVVPWTLQELKKLYTYALADEKGARTGWFIQSNANSENSVNCKIIELVHKHDFSLFLQI